MISMVHIANGRPANIFPQLFLDELKTMGEFTIIENGKELSDDEKIAILQNADVALTGWNSAPLPAKIVDNPGKLQYVCNITGEMSGFVPKEIVESDILVSNWGDNAAIPIAEGSVALLLGVLKDFHERVMTLREGKWILNSKAFGGSLYNANLGMYGCGAIGRRFTNLVKPFGPKIKIYDPYCDELPEDCTRADSLEELFQNSQIIAIFAGLSDETRSSVTAELLAMLPDHGVVINTARGGIVDQDALFAELERGRLRAGLDVLEPDGLPEDHPARTWRNCIITSHQIAQGWPSNGDAPQTLGYMHQVCVDNLRAFAAGEPIKFEMDPIRYSRST